MAAGPRRAPAPSGDAGTTSAAKGERLPDSCAGLLADLVVAGIRS
ncbi:MULTISPECIES: hypothetical protein [Streptomyces]